MIHNIEEVLGYFLMCVICCIFGYVVSLSSSQLLTIYIILVLLFFLCPICSIAENGFQISFLWGLVFFFVVQIIGYATALAMILAKVWSALKHMESGEQLGQPIIWLLITLLLFGCTCAIIYIKLDTMEAKLSSKKCNVIEFEFCEVVKRSVIEMTPPDGEIAYC